MPPPPEGTEDEDPLGLGIGSDAVHPGAVAASGSNMGFQSEPCSANATQRSGAAAAAASGDRGLLRHGRSFGKSAPMTTAAAAAELEDSLDVCAGDQTRKRPQRAGQCQQQPARQQRSVKRHKSQQLLGSSASQEVSNRQRAATRTGIRSARSVSPVLETFSDADWERWDAEQQDIMLQGMARQGTDGYGVAGLFAFTGKGFDATAAQDAAWQQPQQEQAAASGSAGFGDVYSQLPPAGFEGTAQQQQGGQGFTAAGPGTHTAAGADTMMMDPMQEQEAGEADGAWLMREFCVPTSPTLADLLSMDPPAQSPKAVSGWVGAQLPNNVDRSSQHSRMFSQHNGAEPAAAGGLGAGNAAGAHLGQSTAGVLASTGGMQGGAQGAHMHAGTNGHAQLQSTGWMGDANMACMPVPPAQAPVAPRMAPWMSDGVNQEQQLQGSCRTEGMLSAQQQVPVTGFGASPDTCGYASGNSSGSMQSPDGNTGMPGNQMQMQQMQDRLADRLLQGQFMQGPSTGAMQGTGFQQQQQAAPWEAPAANHGNPRLMTQGPAHGSAQAGMGQGYMGMGAAQAAAHASAGNMGPATHSPDTGSPFTSSSQGSRGCDGLQSMLMSALMHGGQHALLSPNVGRIHRRATAQELQRALLINRLQQQQLLQEMEQERSGAAQEQRADASGRISPAFSDGCMGPSYAANRGHGQAAGLPAGHGMQGFIPAQAVGHNSNSMAGFDGAYETGMRSNNAATAAAPAGAARPAMRASPFQNVQQPAGPAARFVQRSLLLLDQQEQPVAATVQGLISFVTEVLRSSNGHVIAAVNSIVPVLATAQQEGYDIQPVLRRVKATLLEAHLQAQRAQLLGVLENAPLHMQQQAAQAAEELAAALKNLVRLDRPAQLQSASSMPDVSTATYFPGHADVAAAGGASNQGLLSTASVGAGYGQPGMNGIFGGHGGFARSNSEQSGFQMAGMMPMQQQRGTATVHMPQQRGGGNTVAGSLEWLDRGFRG